MYSSLRILQVTLVITQITTVKGSSNTTNLTATVSSTNASSVSASSSVPLSQTSSTPAVLSSSVLQYSSVLVSASTEQSIETSEVPYTSTVTIGVSVATSSQSAAQTSGPSNSVMLSPSASQEDSVTAESSEPLVASSVSGNATQAGSQISSVHVTSSKELATETDVSGSSTKATNLSPSGILTRQTQSMTASYSLSSASRNDSSAPTTSEPTATRLSSIIQTLTTSPSVSMSVNWTDWSVDSSDCQKHCSGKGGTVTASRQCYSHSITLQSNVCSKHNISTIKVVKCKKHCPISGKEALRSSIPTLAVSVLLVMLSSTCSGLKA